MDMDMHHEHGYAPRTWACTMDMYMQNGNGHRDDNWGYPRYFNHTFAYEIYYYGIYLYEIYFYSSILLQTVYTSL